MHARTLIKHRLTASVRGPLAISGIGAGCSNTPVARSYTAADARGPPLDVPPAVVMKVYAYKCVYVWRGDQGSHAAADTRGCMAPGAPSCTVDGNGFFIYVCIYVHVLYALAASLVIMTIYIYIYICLYIYAYIYIYIHTHTHIYIQVRT